MTEPRVWIHQTVPGDLEQAVRDGGALVVPFEEADAVVWAADEPEDLAALLHPGIRWVQLLSAGIEDWFEAGVVDDCRLWTAGQGVHAGPIAEYLLAAILAGARGFPAYARQRSWQMRPPRQVAGSTVGIVGAGGIGRRLIELLRPFGVRVLALTRGGRTIPGADVSLGPDGLEPLLRESDYVALAAPQTAETRRLIGAPQLALMREHAWLVNIGRGAVVDTDALVDALRAGRIGGAVLDVTDPEPLPDAHPLWDLPNVLVTGHTASSWELGRPAFLERLRTNVSLFARGEPLLGLVDVRGGY
jgi:phosphoglycerate dehydrogenase-like enzyme